ncbi:trichohyalin-like [Prinia subflava]|uniref:trichohyalin-like n=1 Tax=Prinia subflava TaxID=208062 RepID=UPI002FE3DEEB
MERVRRAVSRAFSSVSSRRFLNGLRRRLRGGRSQGRGSSTTAPAEEPPLARSLPPEAKEEAKDNLPARAVSPGPEHLEPAPAGEILASQDCWAQAGEAEQQESMDRVCEARDFRWEQLSALERKHHSSLARAFETSAETAEELQPHRDLLKEEVPLAVPKVCRPQGPSPRVLERLLQESSRQGDTLSQVCREETVLAQEKAALEAQLPGTERKLRGLSKQLVETRSVKESLQSSLQAAQRRISELEMARSCLEGQVRTATQAKEVILEDVRGLGRELQAVRSLSKQQCEEMAQQLRRMEEQYIKALRLWQSAQEEEKRKLQENLERQLEQQRLEAQQQLEEQANLVAELQHQKAAVLTRMHQMERKLIRSQQQVEQLRLELSKERENGQMDTGSAAASSKEGVSPLQPENSSMDSSCWSSQEREKQCLKMLRSIVSMADPAEKYTGWQHIGSG